MDVSKNNCTPKSFILIGIFHYKPSILGLPYFRKHPYRQTQREQGLTAAGDLGLSSERSQAGVSAQFEGGSGDSCAWSVGRGLWLLLLLLVVVGCCWLLLAVVVGCCWLLLVVVVVVVVGWCSGLSEFAPM